MPDSIAWHGPGWLREVERRSGTQVSACYQCHKCSTGCPVSTEMELQPSQVMRLIHLGIEEELLKSNTIWLCASCQACTTRCPMDIDIATVMDTLRILAVERDIALPNRRDEQFNRSFLNAVRRHGRLSELEMMMVYKLRSGSLLSDMDMAAKLFLKRKLKLLPSRSASVGEVRQAFERARNEEEQK
jgi:heterodisulfide reductase subunit C